MSFPSPPDVTADCKQYLEMNFLAEPALAHLLSIVNLCLIVNARERRTSSMFFGQCYDKVVLHDILLLPTVLDQALVSCAEDKWIKRFGQPIWAAWLTLFLAFHET